MGKLAEAESCFSQAVKCREGMIDEAYYHLGVTLALRGKYQEASACLEEALKIDPKL